MVRKYKETIKCPREFEEIIELVNLLSTNAVERLKILRAIFKRDEKIPAFNNGEPFSMEDLIGVEISKYCFRKRDLIQWSIERYTDLIKARNIFKRLAKINLEISPKYSQKEFSRNKGLQQKVARAFSELSLSSKTFLGIYLGFDINANIKPQNSELLDIFYNKNIPFYRIQSCPACSKFFWAKRIDSKSCGHKQCAEKLSGKNYQTKNKEAINRRKRKKYYTKNGIAFCSKCIHSLSTHGESNCQLNGEKKNGIV